MIYCRDVFWSKELSKSKMDPCLYPIFQAHQAINNISEYKDYIERNIGNYFDLYGWISLMSQLIIINRALYVNKQQEGKICAIT